MLQAPLLSNAKLDIPISVTWPKGNQQMLIGLSDLQLSAQLSNEKQRLRCSTLMGASTA